MSDNETSLNTADGMSIGPETLASDTTAITPHEHPLNIEHCTLKSFEDYKNVFDACRSGQLLDRVKRLTCDYLVQASELFTLPKGVSGMPNLKEAEFTNLAIRDFLSRHTKTIEDGTSLTQEFWPQVQAPMQALWYLGRPKSFKLSAADEPSLSLSELATARYATSLIISSWVKENPNDARLKNLETDGPVSLSISASWGKLAPEILTFITKEELDRQLTSKTPPQRSGLDLWKETASPRSKALIVVHGATASDCAGWRLSLNTYNPSGSMQYATIISKDEYDRAQSAIQVVVEEPTTDADDDTITEPMELDEHDGSVSAI